MIEKAEENEFDEIVVESSPFLRCLQTAAQIAIALKLATITINWDVYEKPSRDMMPNEVSNWEDLIDLRARKRSFLVRQVLEGINIIENESEF